MHFIILFIGVLSLVSTSLAQQSLADANFVFCLDWDPAQFPIVEMPLNLNAIFAPQGSYIHCIANGRGELNLYIPAGVPKSRYCTTTFVNAALDLTGCGPSISGVFDVQFEGPAQFPQREPGVELSAYCYGTCEFYASLFGVHANVVICGDPMNNACDYAASTTWNDDLGYQVPTIGLVWQPSGSLGKDFKRVMLSSSQQVLEPEL